MKNNKCERGIARLYAVLALFQFSHSGDSIDVIFDDFLSKNANREPKIDSVPIKKMHIKFFRQLTETAAKNLEEITPIIQKHLNENWTLERLDPVALCILQLGVCELKHFQTIPSIVIMDEYTEVAKSFFNKTNTSFINGILNTIARELRPNDTFKD